MNQSPILVLGATGKTGQRIVQRLPEKGHAAKKGSWQSDPPFDWDDQSTWDAVLDGVSGLWELYLSRWTMGNHVRMAAALLYSLGLMKSVGA